MTEVVPHTSVLNSVLHGDIVDPTERAERRFVELQRSFAHTLALLSAMQSDEDWRFLKKDDGTPYKGFTELVAVALDCSSSYARRHVQGINNLYMPLQELVVDGTVIEITSRDVAILGDAGARQVIETVADRIPTVDATPEAQRELVNEVIDEQRDQRKKPTSPASDGRVDPADEAGDVPLPSFDAIGGDTPPNGHDIPPSQFDDSATGGKDKGKKKQPSGPAPDMDPDDDNEFEASGREAVGDPLDRALVNCRTYSTEDEIAAIGDADLQNLRRGLNLILRLDPDDVADAITSDLRGVLDNSNEAANRILQIRRIVQTRASWVKKK